jgi:gamma-glutamylputrescine oxidase
MADINARNYYVHTANAAPPARALEEHVAADVVVIGGGFTGVSAALRAAELGHKAVLIEAKTLGFGASGRNGGQLIPGLRWDSRDLVESYGPQLGAELFRLAVSARDRVWRRIVDHKIECALRPGHFHAAWKPAHYEDMCREVEHLHTAMNYSSVEMVRPGKVADIVASPRPKGGMFDHAGGHFHPLNFVFGLGHVAAEKGVQLYVNSPALSIVQTGGKVVVSTPKGQVTANYAMLGCDGEAASLLPALARTSMTVMNYNIATEPLEDAAALIPSGAAISDSRFVLSYFRLSADGRLIFGGGEKYTPTPPANIDAFIRPRIAEIFPQLADVGIAYEWGGAVPVTFNRLPHFGRDGRVFYATGYSGQGALLASLGGELMAEAMAGNASGFDAFAAIKHRRFPGGKLLSYPLYVAGMLWYALRDRV